MFVRAVTQPLADVGSAGHVAFDAVRRRRNTATEGIRLLLRTDPNEEIGEFAQSKVGGAEVAGSAKQALRAVDGAAPSREGDGIVRRNRGGLGDAGGAAGQRRGLCQLLGGPDTYMVGNLIQQQFFDANNFPFGAALTTVMMAFLLIFMIFYLRSAGRAAEEARA